MKNNHGKRPKIKLRKACATAFVPFSFPRLMVGSFGLRIIGRETSTVPSCFFAMCLRRCFVCLWMICPAAWSGAETQPTAEAASSEGVSLPQPVDLAVFESLIADPPFTRTVNPSDSIILTGVAQIEGETLATLLNTQTLQSQVVGAAANAAGWQLLSLGGDPDLSQTWNAKIQVAGGEVITIRYQKPPAKKPGSGSGSGGGSSSGSGGSSGSGNLSSSQLAEAKNAAVNYREGFSGDGYPRQPPPEVVEKLSRLSVSQREEINRQMMGYRNQGLGLDERRRIYDGLLDRSLQGRR